MIRVSDDSITIRLSKQLCAAKTDVKGIDYRLPGIPAHRRADPAARRVYGIRTGPGPAPRRRVHPRFREGARCTGPELSPESGIFRKGARPGRELPFRRATRRYAGISQLLCWTALEV